MRGTKTGSRLLGSLLLLALCLVAFPAGAQEPGRAGLVVQFDESRVETRCLDVAAEGVKGIELLQASGLEVLADVSGGMGVSVCRLEGQGCDFPVQHCFCQCMGGADCAYWNYFYREAGAETWTYSPLGAGLHTVLPGFVDAWVWGDGRTPPAADLTFEAICQPPTPTAVATEAATATPPPATTGSATSATATAPPPATATPAAVAQAPAAGHPAEAPAAPSPAAAAPDGAGGTGGYLAFGGMLLVLAAAGVVVWLRRR
ncbi:MAG: hypothetical protein GX597_03485 [Anaerolineaceae bacterium]|nr:hypothetical protein [Anaerolineaceae bacterium]